MKANVQYNDFIGTSAADISDHTDLNKFLEHKGIDTKRYDSIGASFYAGYSEFFNMSIICLDKYKSENDSPYIVSISFEEEIGKEFFFDLFKRFNVIIISKYNNYSLEKINEEISFNDIDEK